MSPDAKNGYQKTLGGSFMGSTFDLVANVSRSRTDPISARYDHALISLITDDRCALYTLSR